MKTLKQLLSIIGVMIFCQQLSAQDNREDVIYLKNGAIYRGVIVEQIPGLSYKIEIAGGSVIKVDAQDVLKVTKEAKVGAVRGAPRTERRDDPDIEKPYSYKRSEQGKREIPFEYRRRGYFFQGQIMFGFFEYGIRVINGYKFGQFGYLGLGLGIEGVVGAVNDFSGFESDPLPAPNFYHDFSGTHIPLYIYYAGDILKKRTTPFYTAELGYAFRPSPGISGLKYIGGVMASAGIGVRFSSKKRFNFNISLNCDVKNPTNHYNNPYNPQDNYTETLIMFMPSLKFGFGF